MATDSSTWADGIVRLVTPLPYRPRDVNAYLIRLGSGRWMLVDGGIDSEEAWTTLSAGVTARAAWRELRLHVVSHMHLDHIGLTARIRDASSVPLMMGALDAARAEHAAAAPAEESDYRADLMRSNGAPAEVTEKVAGTATDPPRKPRFVPPDLLIAETSERLEEAPEWQVVWTPGHTAGHISLFRSHDRVLVAGDAVIPRVSPTIGVNRQRSNPVEDYLGTLDRLGMLEPHVILGGHGSPMIGGDRIGELRRDVLAEAERVRGLLAPDPSTAWDLAQRRYAGRDLPIPVRVQALRETRAHLDRLVVLGEAVASHDEGRTLFSAAML